MKIETAQLGEIEIDDQQFITIKPGLLGFEEYNTYIIIQRDAKLPFVYLQSIDNPNICLLLANPFEFYREYQFDLGEQDLEELKQPGSEDIAVWVTVSVPDSLKNASINLLAPIIVNAKIKVGRQVVLQNTNYKTKTPLFTQIKEGA